MSMFSLTFANVRKNTGIRLFKLTELNEELAFKMLSAGCIALLLAVSILISEKKIQNKGKYTNLNRLNDTIIHFIHVT